MITLALIFNWYRLNIISLHVQYLLTYIHYLKYVSFCPSFSNGNRIWDVICNFIYYGISYEIWCPIFSYEISYEISYDILTWVWAFYLKRVIYTDQYLICWSTPFIHFTWSSNTWIFIWKWPGLHLKQQNVGPAKYVSEIGQPPLLVQF